MPPLISFDQVAFHYPAGLSDSPAIPALRQVSLNIDPGEFVAVVGANGSGKSTFVRLAGALLQPAEGVVRLDGLDTRDPANLARIRAGLGMVFQFPEDQIVATTVEEDVAFGPENLGLPPAEIRERVETALNEVGLWEHRQRPPHFLSAGQTQRLALAGVLAMRPRCILFDEASTMLDPLGRRRLMETMRRLHAEGLTILFITHFMEEAVQAQRVIVFQQGQVALDGPPEEVFADAQRLDALGLDLPPAAHAAALLSPLLPQLPSGLLHLSDLAAALPAFSQVAGGAESAGNLVEREPDVEPIIRVEELGYVYLRGTPLAHRALSGVNLAVPPGQGYGLLGRTGSGKSTLMQHLNGLLRPQEGRVQVGSFDLNDPRLDRREVVRRVGLVFQNPEAQFFERYVGDEIAFGPRQYTLDEPLAERVRWAMDQVGLDFAAYKDRPLFALSGGERRKVALASTLALRPDILLLDEPTAGLDPRSRQELLEKLGAMRTAGRTLVLSSHQMEDMALLAGTLTIFERGRDVLTGPSVQLFTQVDRLLALGLEPPVSVQVALALREKGWPLPAGVLSLAELAQWVAGALRGERV